VRISYRNEPPGGTITLTQKRQHFVPQHYLRQFRIGSTDQVAIVTIEPIRLVGAGAINRQCQEDYFYGDDKVLENVLAESERHIAPILAALDAKLDFDDRELSTLRFMTSELHARTRKAVEAAKVFPKYFFYEVIKTAIERGDLRPPADGKWTEDMMDVGGVPAFLYRETVIPCWLELQTLNCKLLRASRPANFLTSDNPVVMLNQFAIGADPIRSFVGFGQSGFQLLLPVSPTLCLFFFDAKVYKVGKRGKRLLDVSVSDVEIINALQIQAAEKCLYFHEIALGDEVVRLVKRHANLRVPIRENLKEYPGRNDNERLMLLKRAPAKLPSDWDFCRYRRRIGVRPGQTRNAAWSTMITELMEDIRRNPDAGEIWGRLDRIIGSNRIGASGGKEIMNPV
jgi:hypothetical protein